MTPKILNFIFPSWPAPILRPPRGTKSPTLQKVEGLFEVAKYSNCFLQVFQGLSMPTWKST